MKLLQYTWKNSMMKIINSKMAVFAILMFVMSRTYVDPIRRFSVEADYPSSWCVFPFIMCSFTYLIMFWFGIIYVNSDVPFMQHVNMYHAIRAGRQRWALGQIGGIFIRSVVLVVLAVICTILPLMPDIEWSNEWGKLLRTAGMTNALTRFDSSVVIYYEIFSEFTPVQLMGLEILLCVFICTFIGVLMFLLSLLLNKMAAVAGSLVLAIALFPVLNMHPLLRHKLALFVPSIWAEAARSATPDYGYYWLPSIPYMFGFLIVGILCMTAFILVKIKKIEFNWENEDI